RVAKNRRRASRRLRRATPADRLAAAPGPGWAGRPAWPEPYGEDDPWQPAASNEAIPMDPERTGPTIPVRRVLRVGERHGHDPRRLPHLARPGEMAAAATLSRP